MYLRLDFQSAQTLRIITTTNQSLSSRFLLLGILWIIYELLTASIYKIWEIIPQENLND